MLVKATPHDSSTHFEGKAINLVFDEFILGLTISAKNVIISPYHRVLPGQTSKLNTISVRLPRFLWKPIPPIPSTSGNSIKDINENVMKSLPMFFLPVLSIH